MNIKGGPLEISPPFTNKDHPCLPCTMLGSGPAPPSVGTGAGR